MDRELPNPQSAVPQARTTPTATTAKLIALLKVHSRTAVQRMFSDPTCELGQLTQTLGDAPLQPGPEGLLGADDRLAEQSPRTTSIGLGYERAIGWFDDEYPAQLRHIPDPPLVLYVRGAWQALSNPQIAIVGARRCTRHGKQIAERIAADLANLGVGVTSGLALGVDGAAHKGALQNATQAATVAVLGAGLGRVYPASHARLAQQIIAHGGVWCSEYPDSRPPRPYQFPERNRIIAGLSLATVVVEAGERSGSLITARCALEQGREVFCRTWIDRQPG